MMEVSSIASKHLHDVSVIWYAWPFNVILWKPFQDFLQGHSFNWINNFMLDLFSFPIGLWNFFTGLFFWWFNIFMGLLNWLPNTVFGLISHLFFFFPDLVWNLWKNIPLIIVGALIGIIPSLINSGSSTSTTTK